MRDCHSERKAQPRANESRIFMRFFGLCIDPGMTVVGSVGHRGLRVDKSVKVVGARHASPAKHKMQIAKKHSGTLDSRPVCVRSRTGRSESGMTNMAAL